MPCSHPGSLADMAKQSWHSFLVNLNSYPPHTQLTVKVSPSGRALCHFGNSKGKRQPVYPSTVFSQTFAERSFNTYALARGRMLGILIFFTKIQVTYLKIHLDRRKSYPFMRIEKPQDSDEPTPAINGDL